MQVLERCSVVVISYIYDITPLLVASLSVNQMGRTSAGSTEFGGIVYSEQTGGQRRAWSPLLCHLVQSRPFWHLASFTLNLENE